MVWGEKVDWKKALGERVRALRRERGLSQKQLAQRASLSPRFLADIEAGRANPSLGSLYEMAEALQVDIVVLVARHDSRRSIALLGLRGAGKSTIGKRVARLLGWKFVELDKEIEREAGMALAELFALYGEAHYRTLEHRVLMALLSSDAPQVLATGGGIVTHDESYRLLRQRAHTVWLKATPQEHWDRVLAQGDQRPMHRRSRARAELEELYAKRAPLYAQAHQVVETSALDVESCAQRIAAAISGPQPTVA